MKPLLEKQIHSALSANLQRFIKGSMIDLRELATYATACLMNVDESLRRHEIFIFIAFYFKLTHNAPSHRQIGLAFDLSKTTVRNHLLKLERESYICFVDGHLVIVGATYRLPMTILIS